MAITALTTQAKVEALLSQFGVEARVDDDQDGEEDSGLMTSIIEKCSSDVYLYLLKRYSVAAVAASTWAQWCTAAFCVCELNRRRNNPCPESACEACQRYKEELELIRDGKQPLIGDEGPVAPRFDDLPTVTNLMVDGRYRRAKIRRVGRTSTGPTPEGSRKQFNVLDWGVNQ
jgi:hypothetical protein